MVCRGLCIALAFVTAVFAGCVGEDVADPAPVDEVPEAIQQIVSADGRDLREELLPTDAVPAPVWRVGEIFGHHMFFGADDTTGTHLNGIVVEVTPTSYVMAPDDANVAREHAVWQYPIFGAISKKDLSAEAFGGYEWNVYDFPLSEGKTWTRTFTFPDFAGMGDPFVYELTMTATYQAAIDTLAGPKPGFAIEGVTKEGELYLEFDYVPFYGWYSKFLMYDIESADPGAILVKVLRMGHEYGYSGKYYIATADEVINTMSYVGPNEAGGLQTDAKPYDTFTVGADSDTLFGFVASFAFGGVHEVVLVDPDNKERRYEAVATDAEEPAFVYEDVNEDALPGEWKVLMAGAGAGSGGMVWLWQIKTEVFEMLSEGSASIS